MPIDMSSDNAQESARIHADALASLAELSPSEIWWGKRFHVLESRGYLLRPRFHPGWTPSWLTNGLPPQVCEDYHMKLPEETIDATVISTGQQVAIKRLQRPNEREIEIMQFLSSGERRNDERNHAVPILDILTDNSKPPIFFLVMPYLRPFDNPPFQSVDEVIEFIRQTLEGLAYLHKEGVAHRDCSTANLMMDAREMYPNGWHPSSMSRERDGYTIAKPLRRRDAKSLRYYFIDFGISTLYKDPNHREPVTGEDGLDQDVPELEWDYAYDPYPVDVFILGNVYKQELLKNYTNLSFLRSFTEKMTSINPKNRPTSADALQRFSKLTKKKGGIASRWRLRHRDEPFRQSLRLDLECLVDEIRLQSTRIKGIFRRRPPTAPKASQTNPNSPTDAAPKSPLQVSTTSEANPPPSSPTSQVIAGPSSPSSPTRDNHTPPKSPMSASQIPLPPSPISPRTPSTSPSAKSIPAVKSLSTKSEGDSASPAIASDSPHQFGALGSITSTFANQQMDRSQGPQPVHTARSMSTPDFAVVKSAASSEKPGIVSQMSLGSSGTAASQSLPSTPIFLSYDSRSPPINADPPKSA